MNSGIHYMREISSCKAYEKLLSTWTLNGSTVTVYPDYYSGCYVNDDGNLVVLTTSSEQEEVKRRLAILTGTENIIVEKATYKYSELKEAMRQIDSYMALSAGKVPVSAQCWGIYDDINRIVVELTDCTPHQIALFRSEVFDAPFIEFRQAAGRCEDCITYVKPGRGIFNGGSRGSAAYRAKKGSVKGFITAGHLVGDSEVSVQLTKNGPNIGTVPLTGAYAYGGNLDAAFVAVDGQYEGSLTTEYGGVTLSTQIGTPAAKATVIFEGSTTQAAISGKVVTSSGSYSVNNVLFTNILFVDCEQAPQGGDSGGICYSLYYSPVGCVKGHMENTNRGFFCQAMYINPAFELTMY